MCDAVGDKGGILHIFAVFEEPYVSATVPRREYLIDKRVCGVGLVSPVGSPRLNELTVLRFEIKGVRHVIFAAAVVHESVVFRVRALSDGEVGIVSEQPAARAFGHFGGSVLRNVDDVGEQGVFDDAVHGGGDVVDLDIRQLFQHRVAAAFAHALVEGAAGGRVFVVDYAFGIAEVVEHIVDLAVHGILRNAEGIRFHIQHVAEHDVGKRGGNVRNGDVGEALQSLGGFAFDRCFVISLQSRMGRVGGIVQSVVAVRRQYVRAVRRGSVFAHHDVRCVREGKSVERVAHLVDGRVRKRLQYLRAVVRDVDHFAEFEGGDLVRRAGNGLERFSGYDLHCRIRGAGMYAQPAGVVVVQPRASVRRYAVGKSELRRKFRSAVRGGDVDV